MPKAIYAMGGVSADGWIVGPDGQSVGRRSPATAVVGTR
jgi:hypothetical protein